MKTISTEQFIEAIKQGSIKTLVYVENDSQDHASGNICNVFKMDGFEIAYWNLFTAKRSSSFDNGASITFSCDEMKLYDIWVTREQEFNVKTEQGYTLDAADLGDLLCEHLSMNVFNSYSECLTFLKDK